MYSYMYYTSVGKGIAEKARTITPVGVHRVGKVLGTLYVGKFIHIRDDLKR